MSDDTKPSFNTGSSRAGSHRLDVAATCPQLYAYTQVMRLRPVREPEATALGTMMHLGLAYHYARLAGLSDLDPLQVMREAPARIAHTFPRAEPLFRQYLEHYRSEPFTVLDVEREFEVTVGGYLHTQRIDLVALQAGSVVLYDHKCGATPPKSWTMSTQFASMDTLGRALMRDIYGAPFGGLMVNAIVPGPRPTFDRIPITVEPAIREPILHTIADVNQMIEGWSGRDPWKYRRNYSACMTRYGPCRYVSLCRRGEYALPDFVSADDEATKVET